jgi:pimeloyl-ACP methyl ester carboxylesterase
LIVISGLLVTYWWPAAENSIAAVSLFGLLFLWSIGATIEPTFVDFKVPKSAWRMTLVTVIGIAGLMLLLTAANPSKHTLHIATVLLHGDEDSIVPIAHAISSDSKQRVIKGAGHFDMVHRGTQSFRTLLQELARAFAKQGL